MSPPIARADAAYRRLAMLATLATLLLGALAVHRLAAAVRALGMLAESDPALAAQRFLTLARWVLAVPGVALGLCALLLLRLAAQTWRSRCFPPPGARLLADQPQVTGQAARQRARLVLVLGLLALLGAALLPALLYGRLSAVLTATG